MSRRASQALLGLLTHSYKLGDSHSHSYTNSNSYCYCYCYCYADT